MPASSVLKNFVINLGMNARGVLTGSRLAARSLGRLAGRMRRTGLAAGGLATAFLGIFGVGVGIGLKRHADAMDALSKASRRLDFRELKQLQAYGSAAEEAGIQTNQFVKLITRGFDAINDASKGKGEAVDALKDLGLNAKQLNSLRGEEKMEALAKAFAGLDEPAKRSAAAMDLFGQRGAVMLTLFESLSEKGIEPFLKQLEKSNQAIKNKGGKSIEDMNDAITRLNGSFSGLINQTLVKIAPAIEEAAKFLTKFFSDKGRLRAFTREIKELVTALRDVAKLLGKDGIEGVKKAARNLPTGIGNVKVGDVERGGNIFNDFAERIVGSYREQGEALIDGFKQLFDGDIVGAATRTQRVGPGIASTPSVLLGEDRAFDLAQKITQVAAEMRASVERALGGGAGEDEVAGLLETGNTQAVETTEVLRGIARNLSTGRTTVFQ